VRAEPASAADLVRQCGYLPLAIRITGAKLTAAPHWTIGRVVERYRDQRHRLSALTHGHLDVSASIEISYIDLSRNAKRLLRLLGVVKLPEPSSWIAAALLDAPFDHAEAILDELVAARLLDVVGRDHAGYVRYKLHDLVRLFGMSRAEQDSSPAERSEARARVVRACLHLADAAYRNILGGDYQAIRGDARRWELEADITASLVREQFVWFETESRTVIAAVHLAAEEGLLEEAWELAFSSWRLFQARRYFDDWLRLLTFIEVQLAESDMDRGKAAVQFLLGCVQSDRTDYHEAERHYELALERFEAMGDAHAAALTKLYIGNLHRYRVSEDTPANVADQHIESALVRYRAAHDVFAKTGDLGGRAYALREIGQAHLRRRDYESARVHLGQSLAIYRSINGQQGTATALLWTGMLNLRSGDPAQAWTQFQQALEIVQQISDKAGEGQCYRCIGLAKAALGDVAAARHSLNRALRIVRQPGRTQLESLILKDLADLDAFTPPPS
jgi:tetratricopeptide (TPR) repeat protein